MLNLVIKDMVIQKKNYLFAFLYIIFISICFSSGIGGMGLYVLGPVITTYLLIYNVINFDDKNKSEIIFNSLPVKREDIVIAKYITTFVYAIIGIIFSIIIGFIEQYIGFSIYATSTSLGDIALVFISVCIFAAILFPVYFKFGAVKARIFNILVFMTIFFVPVTAIDYAKTNPNPNNSVVQNINFFINNTSILMQYSLILIIGSIILLSSLMISIRIYKNKEF